MLSSADFQVKTLVFYFLYALHLPPLPICYICPISGSGSCTRPPPLTELPAPDPAPFLSEIKKMRRAVLPAVLLCSWSSLQDSAPQEHFIGRPCPPCSLASFTPPVPLSVGSDAAERRWEQWLGKIREGTNSNAWLVTIHKCLPNLIIQL